MSSIVFDSTLDTSGLEAGIKRANRSIEQWVQGVEKETSGLDKTMSRIGAGIAAYFSVRELANFARGVVETRGEFQKLNIAFETMLGNKEKADKLMQEAITFSQLTPFTLQDVAGNIKQLMAMGIETEKVMDTMKSLGDVAAGVSVPISRLAINYGQVATMGTLQGRELRDFAMAGVPLVEELAKMLGKTKAEIQEMVSAGKVGFPLVEQAFKNMAAEGGKFYNLMEKQNKSVTGQISNLIDKWEVMQNEIGQANEGLIYKSISSLSYLVTNYKQVVEVLKGLVLVLGAAKVATMVVAHEQKIQAAVALLVGNATDKQTLADARWIVMQERKAAAQRALNKSMLANPYVLAAAAIAALGYGIYKLITYETDLEKALKKTNLEIENEKDRALDLFTALKATQEGTEAYAKARQTILDQYGEYIPEQNKELKNLEDIKKAQDAVNLSIAENIGVRTRAATLEEISAEYNPQIIDTQKDIIKHVEKKLGDERAAMVKYELAQLVANYKAGLPDAEKALINYRTRLMQEVGKVNAEGLATSFDAATMAGIFNPLIDQLQSVRTETEAADEAFKKFNSGLVIDKPEEQSKVAAGITADEQRLQLRKQLVEEEKKLKELEKTPGTDPLKAIEDQKKVIAEIKERLELKEEILTIDDEIKKKEEDLDRAVASGNQAEIEAISRKLVQLNRELELRDKLKQSALDKAEFEGFVPTRAVTGHLKTPTLTPKPESKKEKTPQELMNEMNALVRKSEKEGKKLDEEQQKRLEEQLEVRRQIVDSVANLVYELGRTAGLDENSMAMLGSGLETFAQLASGGGVNIVSVASMAISGIQNIISQFPNALEIYESHIDRINYLLDRQQFLIDQSERSGGGADAREGQIELLREQLAIQEKALKKAQDYLDPDKFKLFRSNAGMKRNEERVKELTIAISETSEAIATAEQDLSDFLAGGVTQTTIAQALSDGIAEGGKMGTDRVAEYMNDVLLNAITDIFNKQVLLPLVNDQLYPMIKEALEDGMLSDKEAEDINKTTDELVNSVMAKWKDATAGLDLGQMGSAAGLSGAIRREITEETAGQISGLLRSQKDDIRMSRDYLKIGTEHLSEIDRNTYQTVEELKNAVVELKTISSNTKPAYSGLGGA